MGLLRSVDVALPLVDAVDAADASEDVLACFAFIGLDLVSYNVYKIIIINLL